MTLLLAKEFIVLAKYLDFANVFFENSLNIFSKQTGVNEYTIELEKGKQSLYGPIYSLELIQLETHKSYIKTNWANGFIRTSKLQASALILFVCKPNNSFRMCVHYQRLNNLMIRNWYPLPLIKLIKLSQTIYLAQSHEYLLSNEDKRGQ